jgi:predicted dehydrogenase
MEGSITIFGEKGTVKIGGEYLNELEYQQIEGGPLGALPPGNPPNQYGHYTGSMSNHHLVYEAFSAAILGKRPALTGLHDAINTVSFIEAVYKLGHR